MKANHFSEEQKIAAVRQMDAGRPGLASTPGRALYSSTAYAPEGEPYQEVGAQDHSFTGQKQDIATGQYDFLLREYSPTQGRWWAPDPTGLDAANPDNPQSWNRYGYSNGRPTGLVDGTGAWPTPIHNQILEVAFPGMPSSDISTLESASKYVDDDQSTGGSPKHAMCSPGQQMGACDFAIYTFVDQNIANAQSTQGQESLFFAGEAMHTMADMTSPYHTSADGTPRTWEGGFSKSGIEHIAGEVFAFAMEGPALYDHEHWTQISQAVVNVQAVFAQAYGQQALKSATSGMAASVGGVAWTTALAGTGAFPSTVLVNEISGCLMGNPAACPDFSDLAFAGFMGMSPEYLGYVWAGGKLRAVK